MYVIVDEVLGDIYTDDKGNILYFTSQSKIKEYLEKEVFVEGVRVVLSELEYGFEIYVVEKGNGKYSELERIEYTDFIAKELIRYKGIE